MGNRSSATKRASTPEELENDVQRATRVIKKYAADTELRLLRTDALRVAPVLGKTPGILWKNMIVVELSRPNRRRKELSFRSFYALFERVKELDAASDEAPSSDVLRASGGEAADSSSSAQLVLLTSDASLDNTVTDENLCPICYESAANEVLECSHAFCNKCLLEWRDSNYEASCPICRAKMDLSTSWVVNDVPTEDEIFAAFTDFIEKV